MADTAGAQRHFRIALQAWNANDWVACEQHCRRSLAFDARHADSWHLLGVGYARCGRLELSNTYIREALRCFPYNAQYWFNLGVGYQSMEALESAYEAYAWCLRLMPNHRDACQNQIEVLRRTERFSAALELNDRIQKLGLDVKALACHRAICQYKLGEVEAAEQSFRLALQEMPNLPTIPWEFSHLLLAQHRFDEGWTHYERRFDAPAVLHMNCARLPVPRWQGEALSGKTILVHREQGLGDQIMFASVVPDLLKQGADVLIDAALPLRPLFAASFPQARLAPLDANGALDLGRCLVESIDFEAPIGSACARLRRKQEDFPAVPYCCVSPQRLQDWRERVDAALGPKKQSLRIGLVWSSNPIRGLWSASRRAGKKSIPLDQFDLLQASGRQWISLHDQAVPAESSHALKLVDFSAALCDFEQTAALASTLDLVITVDTAVAHLSGALGLPTWVLLPYDADWRWGQIQENRSYWYRDMRLFRQSPQGDWRIVIKAVAQALLNFKPVSYAEFCSTADA